MKKSSFLTYSFQIVGEKPTGKQRSFQAQKSNKGCSHYSNTSPNQRLQKKSRNPSQLSLLSQQIGASIEPVPQHLALAPDRFYLWLAIDFERGAVPIQLTEKEAIALLPLVEGERDRSQALNIVEGFLPSKGVQS